MKCVIKGMSALGPSEANSTLFHLEQTQGLHARDIPDEPDRFTFALRGIFGLGSGALLNSILAELRTTDEFTRDRAVMSFAARLEEARKSIESGII
jgi:hypothetical protein